jgi:hypothetical protein
MMEANRRLSIRIESIDIYHVAMPLLYPWRTAYGEDAAIESVLVRMESAVQVGWSETTPFAAPCYSRDRCRRLLLQPVCESRPQRDERRRSAGHPALARPMIPFRVQNRRCQRNSRGYVGLCCR